MTPDRRALLAAGLGLGGLTLPAVVQAQQQERSLATTGAALGRLASEFGVEANTARDQTAALQAALDRTARDGQPLWLAPGRYRISTLRLPAGGVLLGIAGRTLISRLTPGPAFEAAEASTIRMAGLAVSGIPGARTARELALLDFKSVSRLALEDIEVSESAGHGIRLHGVSGHIRDCNVSNVAGAGIISTAGAGLEISGCRISDCADNGILIWQEPAGDGGTVVSGNRIARISARSGGSGQYGNGINVFQAHSALVSQNRISDCAYSAVRGNAASNIQILANSCRRIGEVALYAEFGFEGAIIANNVVEQAATGIAVTNFDRGGRLAVVQGNLVRNLVRREHEPIDKRGDGITVEADAAVSGNVIEQAANFGIMVGWGPYMRDVAVTGNVIRLAKVGIGISQDHTAGRVLVAQNLISGSAAGAIRAFDHGRALGEDLVNGPSGSRHIALSGNIGS